ncbi:hypothetical protein BDA99DRAFT_495306, partial [Phascolomyces articulosus]
YSPPDTLDAIYPLIYSQIIQIHTSHSFILSSPHFLFVWIAQQPLKFIAMITLVLFYPFLLGLSSFFKIQPLYLFEKT